MTTITSSFVNFPSSRTPIIQSQWIHHYASLVRASKSLSQARHLHSLIAANARLSSNTFLLNLLIDAYSKRGSLADAESVFSTVAATANLFSWNLMIAAYARAGHPTRASHLFHAMQLHGFKPDVFSFATTFQSCRSFRETRHLHAVFLSSGLQPDETIHNVLLHVYGQHGGLEEAMSVFHSMEAPSLVSWTTIIAAHSQLGRGHQARSLFHRLNLEGIGLDKAAVASALDSCCSLSQGRAIHRSILDDPGFEMDPVVETALATMYVACGEMDEAAHVFAKMKLKDVVCWTSMIKAHSQSGDSQGALELFHEMQMDGFSPTRVSFLVLVWGFTHAGLVELAFQVLAGMEQDHGVMPELDMCACVIDLLARTGKLEEAEVLLLKMPFQPDAVTLTTVLSACRLHGDDQRAARISETMTSSCPTIAHTKGSQESC